jgi:hypothetical protein
VAVAEPQAIPSRLYTGVQELAVCCWRPIGSLAGESSCRDKLEVPVRCDSRDPLYSDNAGQVLLRGHSRLAFIRVACVFSVNYRVLMLEAIPIL